ncbi:hypothetical protein EOQ21_22725 [Salmonella bongori serovar 48:i:-]|nr:hypothetical protein [Salmonella bongori serovar 48:i:-]
MGHGIDQCIFHQLSSFSNFLDTEYVTLVEIWIWYISDYKVKLFAFSYVEILFELLPAPSLRFYDKEEYR